MGLAQHHRDELDGPLAKLKERGKLTMMDLEERVTKVEERVTKVDERVTKVDERMELVSQRATVAHDTAGDALHVAHLNAGLLNALRETQVEHGKALVELRGDVSVLQRDVSELRGDVSEMRGDVSELRAGQGAIVGLLEELIRRDDERQAGPDPHAGE